MPEWSEEPAFASAQGRNRFLSWFKSQMMKVVRDRIAELLVKKKWALLDVTSGAYTEEIEQDVLTEQRASQ